MTDFKTIAGRVAIAGSLGLAALGIGSGLANAVSSPGTWESTSVQESSRVTGDAPVSRGDGPSWPQPDPSLPNPYAGYGGPGPGVCTTPPITFANVCV